VPVHCLDAVRERSTACQRSTEIAARSVASGSPAGRRSGGCPLQDIAESGRRNVPLGSFAGLVACLR
jgi:hypothetical protein